MRSIYSDACELSVGTRAFVSLLGVVEALFIVCLYVYVKRSEFLAKNGSRKASSILCLPVYNLVWQYVLYVTLIVSTLNFLSYDHHSLFVTSIKYFLFRIVAEGLALFLTHNGVGTIALRSSFHISSIWCILSTALPLCVYFMEFGKGMQAYYTSWVVVYSIILVGYLILWLAPFSAVNRRPAALRYSRFLAFAASLQLLAHACLLYYWSDEDGECLHEEFYTESFRTLVSAATDVIQPFLILRLLVDDSRFWQGLVDVNTSGGSVVNQPLVGMWDQFGRNTINEVAETIEVLQKEIVPIIPFGMISMDAATFVAGGAARVYRGRVKNQEVAIKILFCIDLTPQRVVDFCKESTLLYSLRSSHIVKCLGVAIMPPALCLVTEYCLYGSLFDFLHAKRNAEFIRFIRSKSEDLLQVTVVEGNVTLTDAYNDKEGIGGYKVVEHKNEDLNKLKKKKKQKNVSNSEIIAGLLEEGDRVSGAEYTNGNGSSEVFHTSPNPIVNSFPPRDQSFKSNSFASMSGSIDPYAASRRRSLESMKLDIENSYRKEELVCTNQNMEKLRSAIGVFKSRRFRFGYGPKGVVKVGDVTNRRSSQANSLYERDSIGKLLLQKKDPKNDLSTADTERRVSVFARLHNLDDSTSMGNSGEEGDSSKNSYVSMRYSEHQEYFLGKTLPLQLKLRMARDCSAGVAFLHSKGLMHCDIKSLNFLVTEDLHVKLSDLGEARSNEDLNISSMEARALPRNINWAAPELLRSDFSGVVNDQSDVWSLAMVVAEIFSGDVPFDSEQHRKLHIGPFLEQIQDGLRPNIPDTVEEAFPWIVETLNSAWTYEPGQRLAASVMMEKVEEALLKQKQYNVNLDKNL